MISTTFSSERLMSLVTEVQSHYYRLIIVAGPMGSGKTGVLRSVSDKTGAPIVNVNLEVSRDLLPMTERQRSVRLPRVMEQIVATASAGRDLVLLDNVEVLFDAALKQDPLRLLQRLSRNRTIISTWAGRIDGREIVYADPEHPEYRRYPIMDFEVVELEVGQ